MDDTLSMPRSTPVPGGGSASGKGAAPDLPAATSLLDDGLASASTSLISLRILELLANTDEACGVTAIAAALDVPKARAHRHLTALKQQGFVTQDARSSRYRIGWRLFLLGQRVIRQFDVVALARPIMEELRDTVGQTIVISTFDNGEVIVLDLVRGRSMLEILLNPGTKFALHTVAQGKIALAFGPPSLLQTLLQAPLAAPTPRTVTEPERLRAELALVRERGWAEAPEEVFLGINALAAPLYQSGRTLFGAVAIVGSIHYLPAQAEPQVVQALRSAAARISALLGAVNGP